MGVEGFEGVWLDLFVTLAFHLVSVAWILGSYVFEVGM